MRQTVAVKGAIFDGEEYKQEAVEVWTNGDVISLTYHDFTMAVEIEPVNKLIKAVRRGKHNQK